jgi:hypothetical protein
MALAFVDDRENGRKSDLLRLQTAAKFPVPKRPTGWPYN